MSPTFATSMQYRYARFVLMLLFTLFFGQSWAAGAKLSIGAVRWSEKTRQLTINAAVKGGAAGSGIEVYDLNGRRLGSSSGSTLALTLSGGDLPVVPCSVRVQSGSLEAIKAVSGNPNKACKQIPSCRILTPDNGHRVKLGEIIDFTASAKFGDKKAQPKYEWDFGGGAMGETVAGKAEELYKRPNGIAASVKFVRDNSIYRVHFSAVDGRTSVQEGEPLRCDDTVEIIVGNPPTDVPNMTTMVKASQQSAPKLGSELDGKKGDLVVLPYEDLTLQCTDDARQSPYGYIGGSMSWAGINAVVYQKDLKPPQRTDVNVRYSAATNPADPVGVASINSTSQNWPLNSAIRDKASPYASAAIAKADRWDTSMMPANGGANIEGVLTFGRWTSPTTPDQGFTLLADLNNTFEWPGSVPMPMFDSEHGQRMPGFDEPYVANDVQDFTGYSSQLNAYQSRGLPLTDVDDKGQVNPFPLLRIQAVERDGGETLASTDVVQTSGRDFHCRECHVKGKIGATDSGNVNKTWKDSALAYSSYNQDTNGFGGNNWDFLKDIAPVKYYDSVDVNGKPSNAIADQEYAALRNIGALHSFYDGFVISYDDPALKGAATCVISCHTDSNEMAQYQAPTELFVSDMEAVSPQPVATPTYYDTNYSMNMHKWHGQLQYNDNKDGVLRDEKGVPLRWDLSKGYNTRTLFPVKDSNGKPLPMEQNCLKCHAGQREQCYRDRMYTAGVTCYQCHGDLLAVGQAYPKKQPTSDGHKKRLDYHDQPDCGSCHVGSANVGKANPDFFSVGVRNLAFDKNDPSATPLPVDWSNPDTARFAVPVTPAELNVLQAPYDYAHGGEMTGLTNILRFDGPLYRLGKDTHGNVPCGACHGGAHAVWPNRDPNANDNVTALQLQGHTGTILECNVCHDKEAFKAEGDLDGSELYSGDPKPGILGGPHNIHPINDPYWWKSTQGDSTNADGTSYGGWHNNYAKKSGKANEDQCAACHGNDHKGTRLSRTPVDRVFDFSGSDFAKLKKAGFKSKVIKVAAGTPIGCDTCHSINTSCIGSPAGAQCGIASTVTTPSANKVPMFTAEPGASAKSFVIGQSASYSYTPKVSDPDGDKLTFGLSTRLDSMTIDANTGKVSILDWEAITRGWFGLGQQLPFTYRYMITVADGKGGFASQQVPVTLSCPEGKVWGYEPEKGVKECLTNTTPVLQLPPLPAAVAGEAFTITFSSKDSDHSGRVQTPLYSLSGAPSGMTLGLANGVLKWTPTAAGTYTFSVLVNDQVGGSDSKRISLHVCASGQTWSDGVSSCVANHSPLVTSTPPVTAHVNQLYSYSPTVTDADSDTPQFSLFEAPTGMRFTGSVLNWTPGVADAAAVNFKFSVVVTDSKGGIAIQQVNLGVCPTDQTWHAEMGMCM